MLVESARLKSLKLPVQPSRLLVADDEHLVAAGLTSLLNDLGFTVVGPVSDGDAAIDMCKTASPDMCLLDIRMPKKDGMAAAAAIFSGLCVPVIILSAYPQYDQDAVRAGVFGYLLKPATHDQLKVTISTAWGRFCDWVELNRQNEMLKRRLEERILIERSKWILVERLGITEEEAHKRLQQQARNTRRTIADVARSVIENDQLFGRKPDDI
jgi:response regulator NasT